MPTNALSRQAVPSGPEAHHELPAFLSAEDLRASPRLPLVVCQLSTHFIERYSQHSPGLIRAASSHQRWLLSQGAFALYLEHDPARRDTGLTVAALRQLITGNAAASRNTVMNYLEEMRHYRFVHDLPQSPSNRGRRKFIGFSEHAENAMRDWLRGNLAALDHVDDGHRLAVFEAQPDLFRRAQPVAARACIEDPAWADPPYEVGIFQWMDGGGLVMDQLVACAGTGPCDDQGRIVLGAIRLRKLADDFLMSHTHLQRVFRKAAEAGIIGWTGPRRKADLWISEAFLKQYRDWQAVKLSHVDRAFRQAEAEARAERGMHRISAVPEDPSRPGPAA